MRAPRGFFVWTALAVCAALVLGAMLWLTRGVMQAERERLKAEQERVCAENRADLEERTRLALWRMDALGASIMLRENQVPADQYEIMFAELATTPEVLLRFRFDEDRKDSIDLAMGPGAVATQERRERLESLGLNAKLQSGWLDPAGVTEPSPRSADTLPSDAVMRQFDNSMQRKTRGGAELRKDQGYQNNSNVIEMSQRAKAVAQTMEKFNQPSDSKLGPAFEEQKARQIQLEEITWSAGEKNSFDVGPMEALWASGELFLRRNVVCEVFPAITGQTAKKKRSLQCVWLDSKTLSDQMLKEVADLLPDARLVPAEGMRDKNNTLALVSFPFLLERNENPGAAIISAKPSFGAPLWVAWIAALCALVAVAVLVRGVMRLSERRASFVSAVTHELRTPLTTFRLYSDMLETGAVKPEKRGEYLRVLSREADRLSHLVENVLAFSRIERGNARSNVRDAPIRDLLEQSRERLEARLATAGLTLEMDSSCEAKVRADTAAVEHILFNLIDNAAKYAAAGDPPVVRIHAQESGRFVEIIVSDHGPGIPASEHGRIFRAFHKSAREAAESKPGVGLGLALSRRLAREQGGDLECSGTGKGACFVLRLPAAGVAL